MKRLFSTLCLSAALIAGALMSVSCIDEPGACGDYDELKARLDALESSEIVNLKSQLAAFNSSLTAVENKVAGLENCNCAEELATLKTTLEDLKSKVGLLLTEEEFNAYKTSNDAAVAQILTQLAGFVSKEEYAAFTTKYNGDVTRLLAMVNGKVAQTDFDALKAVYDSALVDINKKLADLQGAVKEDEFNAFKAEVTKAQQDMRTELDELQTTVDALGTKVSKLDTAVTTLSTTVSSMADTVLGLSTDVGILKGQVENLTSRVSALETALAVIKEQMTALMNKINSVVYVPDYSDGQVRIKVIPETVEMKYEIRPASLAAPLVKAITDEKASVSFVLRSVATRATNPGMLIKSISCPESGTILVTAVVSGIVAEQAVAVSLLVTDTYGNEIQSNYTSICYAFDANSYIENGICFGEGIEKNGVIWAPVNCGFEPATDESIGYPYGKFYQWGRFYGQGSDAEFDATVPEVIHGTVTIEQGQQEANKGKFYAQSEEPFDWTVEPDPKLWNLGTVEAPVKSDYDPCPVGWRVPTEIEAQSLLEEKGFLPLAGFNNVTDGKFNRRDEIGFYWTSTVDGTKAKLFYVHATGTGIMSKSRAYGHTVRCVRDGQASVTGVIISRVSLALRVGESEKVTAKVEPSDAANKQVQWSSSDESVAIVDNGKITALKAGTATITVKTVDGGFFATCFVTVNPVYYVENGVNHGEGLYIAGAIWAPVNCGFEAATDDAKGFPYGKLYQWGRRYGQGYSSDYDTTVPEIVPGPVEAGEGNSGINSNSFFTNTVSPNDWAEVMNDHFWNREGDIEPDKTSLDPCPAGWRVPTWKELSALGAGNHSSIVTLDSGVSGMWFSGEYPYSASVNAIFLPAAGLRLCDTGVETYRKERGYYWASAPNGVSAFCLNFYGDDARTDISMGRANGSSVRCVKE
jgi:uncharacterized protein (TIGR02145 family)